MTRLLQILPRATASVCGISDYGRLLARELRDRHNIHSSFLTVKDGGQHARNIEGFPVFDLQEATSRTLLRFLISTKSQFHGVLLHMSPYGFQKKGVPLWLAVAWRRVFQERMRPALLTMFHELFATGSPSGSAFWLRPFQEFLLGIVSQSSDGLRTNRAAYADWLRRACGSAHRDIPVMPVFSNMGEVGADVFVPAHRYRQMTVFGSTVASTQLPLLAEICQRKAIRRLGWVGLAEPPALKEIVETRFLPHLPVEEAASWFGEYGLAFTGYNPDFLAKSGIFAAYAAHKVAVLLPTSRPHLPDNLSEGVHFLPAKSDLSQVSWEEQARQASSGLHLWYAEHDLKATAASYAAQIQAMTDGILC